jgi:hypothetical protein
VVLLKVKDWLFAGGFDFMFCKIYSYFSSNIAPSWPGETRAFFYIEKW